MTPEIPLMLFIGFLTLFFILMMNKRKTVHAKRLPPGPAKLPVIGNLHQLGKMPHRSLQNLSKKSGDLMYLQLGSVPALVVSSPDRARDIFKNHDLAFSGRAPLYALSRISYQFSSVSTAPYGECWRELRKIMFLELMTAKRVQSFGHIRVQEVDRKIERISCSGAPYPVDLSSLAFSLSNNVVCRVALGDMNPADVGNGVGFRETFHDLQRLAGEFNVADFFPWLAWVNRFNGTDKRLEKVFHDMDTFYNKVIEQHVDPKRAKRDPEDIIDVLLRIQKDPNQTIALTDEQIKGFLADVFVAGTDTSAATIVWTMTELIRNPMAKEKAQQEVRKIAKGKAKVEEADVPKLTYLKQVIKESLRLHPPAPLPVPRETIEKCTVDNKYDIPAKTRVFFNVAAISTDPGYWENPKKFLPERFMDSLVDFRGQDFELLPFGSGRRGCPGINFSISLVELALANLLFCFDWELPKGMSAKDIDMEEAIGITMHKKIPLCLIARPVN